MFTVTTAAAQQIQLAASHSDATGLPLRIAARQEPDGSISYGMGFDELGDDDEPLESEGLTLLIASSCRPLLEGTVLDFVEIETGQFSFIFIPPRAEASSCGTGGCPSCKGGCA